jgi:hypothetical protein
MQRHWLTRPRNIRRLWMLFIAILAATVAAELLTRHSGHFGLDGTFGFHAWYGFAACAALILVAKLVGLVLKRPDGYYGERND